MSDVMKMQLARMGVLFRDSVSGAPETADGTDLSVMSGRPKSLVLTPSVELYDCTVPEASTVIGTYGGTVTTSASSDYGRRKNRTLKVDCTGLTSGNPQLQMSSATGWQCSATDKLIGFSMCIPWLPVGFAVSITVTVMNTSSYSSDYESYSINGNSLRQGWNDIRLCGKDAVGSNTLPHGFIKTVGGVGVDWSLPIKRITITFPTPHWIGRTCYLDSIVIPAKCKTAVVIGFDATGANPADATHVNLTAPALAERGVAGYYTMTYVYDAVYWGDAQDVRREVLYDKFNWCAVNHFWNHGAGSIGKQWATGVSGTRASNTVTLTIPEDIEGYVSGNYIYVAVSGATPTDANGVFRAKTTGVRTITYTAPGADGALTGTLSVSTKASEIIQTATSTTYPTVLSTAECKEVLRHEIVDNKSFMLAKNWVRGLCIGAYPSNACGELSIHQAICDEAGIRLYRGTQGDTCKVSEFGVDNPLNFGSVSMSGGASGNTLQYIKDKVQGAINRGESIWIYGHVLYDDTLLSGVNTNYPPGNNGNPSNPYGAAIDGQSWWFGSFKRLLSETIDPAVASGSAVLMSAVDFAAAVSRQPTQVV